MDFSGQAVLVTGGTRGIGREIARSFLEHGASVLVCARRSPDLPIAAGDREAEFMSADLRETAQVEAVAEAMLTRFGRFDVLINNAGGSPPADAGTASPRFARSIIALNLTAPLELSQRAWRTMRTEGGVILNIGSASGMRASPGTAAYGAAKAGLLNLTKSLAQEWAPKVRVNAISAGPVDTEADLYAPGVAGTIPLGRLVTPADIANACLFLASPLASAITGANLVIDGGGDRPAFLSAAKER